MGDVEGSIRRYRLATIDYEDGLGGEEDWHLYTQMSAAFHDLIDAGAEGCLALRELLRDESIHVRCWTAAALLHGGDREARYVLEEICGAGGLVGLSAEMTLKEYDAGRLGSPFPRRGA